MLIKTLGSLLFFCTLGGAGWYGYQHRQDIASSIQPTPIIEINLIDATTSTERIPKFERLAKELCQQQADLARNNDQAIQVWFSNQAQIADQKTITTKLASRQLCKNITPPDALRQIDPNQGTSLTAAITQIPILAEHSRQQSGQLDKPVLAVIVIDANDGEANTEAEWLAVAQTIETLGNQRMVVVAIVSDAKLLNHFNQYVRSPNFQACPLNDAKTCLEWGYRTARAL
jgi:hypothetical protein